MKREERKQAILQFMMNEDRMFANEWISPTVLGQKALGLEYHNASSITSRVCQDLVREGLLERDRRGWYRMVER